jgi:catechol 2,3-dioxygenase-like lactoylglutathione lyase family enzyme
VPLLGNLFAQAMSAVGNVARDATTDDAPPHVRSARILAQTIKEHGAVQISGAIPLIRIFSEEKAREFYVDFLGFSIEWEHRFEDDLPLYAQIRRGELVIHLTGHHGDATPGSTLFIPMTGIENLHAELNAKRYAHARPGIKHEGWGKIMEIADPFGNRLRFCELSPD